MQLADWPSVFEQVQSIGQRSLSAFSFCVLFVSPLLAYEALIFVFFCLNE